MLDRIPLGYYAFAGLLNFLTSFALLIFVFLKNPKSRINQAFCLFALSVAGWGLSYLLWLTTDKSYLAEGYLRTLMVFVIFIPTTFTHFVLNLLKLDRRKFNIFNYLFSTILAVTAYTNYFAYNPEAYLVFPYWLRAGFLFYVHTAHFFGCAIYAHYLMLRALKARQGLYRNQVLYVLIGTGIGFSGGALNYLTWSRIPVPPFLNPLVSIYVATVAYAIIRHRLMDIEVIIKRTLVFAGLSSFVVACFSIPLFLLPKVFAKSLTEEAQLWLLVMTGMVVAALLGPLNGFLVNMTDRFLFQKKKEIKVILKDLAERATTIFNLEEVGRAILSALIDAFRLESGMIVIRDRNDEKFRLLENSGVPAEAFVETVRRYFNHPDIKEYFISHRSTVSLDTPSSGELPNSVSDWLKTTKGRVCVPLFIDEDRNGFLILGKKKSDQEFSQEEADYFPTIASQVCVAIQKANLLQTVIEEREAKVRAENLAKRVAFAGLIKHEIQNKLVHIEMPANAALTYCIPRLKTSFKEEDEKRFSELCDEIADGSKKITFAANRVRIIAQTAKGGVDEKDKSFQELDCKVLWDDAKEESGIREKCDFESKMPEGFTVYGNYHALQRTFVNLITNAWDAMKGKDEPLIKLRCSYENMEGKQVAYFEVEDSGCGIPKEIQGEIFEDGFSTKPKPDAKDLISSGHGQGLTACKLYIESVHNGKIWVESEMGKGATFKFWIPMTGNNAKSLG